MPKLPPRKGIAYQPGGHHGGFRAQNGDIIRPGPDVFVMISLEDDYWGLITPVARLHRVFGHEGDAQGEYRLSAEINWTLDNSTCQPFVTEDCPIPDESLALLSAKRLVEVDWTNTVDFESILNLVKVYPLPGNEDRELKKYEFLHVGTAGMAMTRHEHAPKPKSLTTWKAWGPRETLETMVPQPRAKDLQVPVDTIKPASADDDTCHLARPTPAAAGPYLERVSDFLKFHASDVHVSVQVYEARDGVKLAHGFGDPYKDPFDAVEMHGEAELSQLLTGPAAEMMARPRQERLWVLGENEITPGFKLVKIKHSSVVDQIHVVNPSLVEHLMNFSPEKIGTFETAVKRTAPGATLVATSPPTPDETKACVQYILGPLSLYKTATQIFVQEQLVTKTSRKDAALDPCEMRFPLSYVGWLALLDKREARRSNEKRTVQVWVFTGDDDIKDFLGSLGWPAPKGKERYAINSIFVPEPTKALTAGATVPTKKGKKTESNMVSMDPETLEFYMRVSIVRFNASKRIRGADVGGPAEAASSSAEPVKFDAVHRAYVPRSAKAPTPREMKSAYPGPPTFAHWK